MKPGLAWLTKKWCGREIQNRGEGGHDPEEDARACIDLLKKKIENGMDLFTVHPTDPNSEAFIFFPLNRFSFVYQVLDSGSSKQIKNRSSRECQEREAGLFDLPS